MENRETKHKVAIELLMEVLEEEKQLLEKVEQLVKQKTKDNTQEIERELKHLTTVHREQRSTIKWLKRKIIRLEEEA